MKPSGGLYLLGVGIVYLITGMIDIFVYKFDQSGLLPLIYCVILSLPLFVPPLARYLNMESVNMFNWFSKEKEEVPSNVVEFPKPKAPLELVKPRSRECYRIGYDEEAEMVSLTLMSQDGYGSITLRMNYAAAQQMIKMINTAFPEYDPALDESVK
jgi:hypothetical protein